MRLFPLLAGVLLLAGCAKPVKLSYPDAAAARAAGAIDHGWLPPFLPEAARSIEAKHDPDGRRPMAVCRLLPADFDILAKKTVPVPSTWKEQLGDGFYPGDFRPHAEWQLLYVPEQPRQWYLAYNRKSSLLVLWK